RAAWTAHAEQLPGELLVPAPNILHGNVSLRTLLRFAAMILVTAAFSFWLARGANRGWTKTSVSIRTLDPVLGFEGITYEQRFVPGVEFLATAALGAAILGGSSLLVGRKRVKDKLSARVPNLQGDLLVI